MTDFYKVPVSTMTNQADFHRPHYQVIVPNYVTIEDLLRPGAWVHHAAKFDGKQRRFGVIEVLTEDGLLEVHLRVLEVRDGLLRVRPNFIYQDKDRVVEQRSDSDPAAEIPDAEPVPNGYKIGHAPATGFWVKLNATNDMIFKGLPNRRAALEKAITHAKMAGTYQKAA